MALESRRQKLRNSRKPFYKPVKFASEEHQKNYEAICDIETNAVMVAMMFYNGDSEDANFKKYQDLLKKAGALKEQFVKVYAKE